MFYKTQITDHIRVPPELFNDKTEDSIIKEIKRKYDSYISKDLGIVIDVSSVETIQDGTIIPGDGAPYYKTVFTLLTFKPEMQEIVFARVKDVADFGAFMNIGPIEGMIHISQTMDDFVSFGKDGVLLGKESKRTLKANDKCKARIIAISYKDLTNPKFGLTMRQEGLGRVEWIQEDKDKKAGKKK
jgi:DNA-directed RNA polymerase subunit E'